MNIDEINKFKNQFINNSFFENFCLNIFDNSIIYRRGELTSIKDGLKFVFESKNTENYRKLLSIFKNDEQKIKDLHNKIYENYILFHSEFNLDNQENKVSCKI
jgi:hypothetical protein